MKFFVSILLVSYFQLPMSSYIEECDAYSLMCVRKKCNTILKLQSPYLSTSVRLLEQCTIKFKLIFSCLHLANDVIGRRCILNPMLFVFTSLGATRITVSRRRLTSSSK